MYKYIITGCPRSGTKFVAKLLTQGGIPCNHELIWGMPGIVGLSHPNAIAESSWMAAPFISSYKQQYPDSKIIHIIRNPLMQISSTYHKGIMEDYSFRSNLYAFYRELYLPILRRMSVMDRYIYFWIYWNRIAGEYADYTYRLEDLVENPKIIFDDLGVEIEDEELSTEKVNEYKNVKRLTFHHIKNSEFKDELIKEALKYEYKIN